MKLHKYQESAIKFATKQNKCFLMMDIGLGKTAVALKLIEKSKCTALVMAPLQVCWSTWPAEIKLWTPKLSYVILHGKNKDNRINCKKDIYILPYSSLKWFYNKLARTKIKVPKMFLILDESSYIKDPKTQRFKMIKKLEPIFRQRKLCLSATPAPNGLHELWSQYFILDKGMRLGRTFYSFRDKYFLYTGPPVYKTTIMKGSETKIYKHISDITFRLDAKDYLDMPPIIYNKIKLKLPTKLMKQYKELETNFFLKINKKEIEIFNAAALSTKLRQFLAGCLYIDDKHNFEQIHTIRLKMLQQLLETNAGQPILAVINFRFEYEIMKRIFDNPPIIYGGTPLKTKQRYIVDWNSGSLPLLLAHPASVSHGLNLQAGGRTIVWMALPWSLDQYHQLNGRLHRQGQKQAVIVNNLTFEGTIDEVVEQTLRRKDKTQKDLLNALRQYAKGM